MTVYGKERILSNKFHHTEDIFMITIDVLSAIHTLNEICGILSFLVSLIALWKVSDIQKNIKVGISGNSAKLDIAGQRVAGNKNSHISQAGGNNVYHKPE